MEQRFLDLLKQKNFEELSSADMKYILEMASKEDYTSARGFLESCKTNFETGLALMEPNEEIHDNLIAAYRYKYKGKVKKELHTPQFYFGNVIRTPVFRYAALVSLLMSLVLFLLLLEGRIPTSSVGFKDSTAMDIDQIKNFDKMNQYLCFKNAGLHAGIIIPETHWNP